MRTPHERGSRRSSTANGGPAGATALHVALWPNGSFRASSSFPCHTSVPVCPLTFNFVPCLSGAVAPCRAAFPCMGRHLLLGEVGSGSPLAIMGRASPFWSILGSVSVAGAPSVALARCCPRRYCQLTYLRDPGLRVTLAPEFWSQGDCCLTAPASACCIACAKAAREPA